MKRRKAILLFSGIFLSILAYVAWCARPLYLKPPLKFQPNITEALREFVGNWYDTTTELKPTEFSWEGVGFLLRNPWKYIERPAASVFEGGLGGEGSLSVSYGRDVWVSNRNFGNIDWTPLEKVKPW